MLDRHQQIMEIQQISAGLNEISRQHVEYLAEQQERVEQIDDFQLDALNNAAAAGEQLK